MKINVGETGRFERVRRSILFEHAAMNDIQKLTEFDIIDLYIHVPDDSRTCVASRHQSQNHRSSSAVCTAMAAWTSWPRDSGWTGCVFAKPLEKARLNHSSSLNGQCKMKLHIDVDLPHAIDICMR